MLANNFYTVDNTTQLAENHVSNAITINAAHPIFGGHFPEQPVVPGVCMMQTITELLGNAVNANLLLDKASSMKFLNMIDPTQQPNVNVDLQYSFPTEASVKVNAVIKSEATVFLKFQGTFHKQ
ncbi:3-hydroxyacyl-[acyl-carrier-protein] dehydratase [Chitinophaga skermanii]|uniref:3-hydroxyacyl-[acyl-carrier-protein] dehydratase n=1 Tax=Chitinophaga skermanii TaxID=331697 RepID=A0A327QH01_9BACT|nr:3-hydroxyacyl-ACP dehydratase [Chitinophaga skermanii]RAJ02603.1 3-hydroxyacyl-[acyl-carrier-protein] dehydratase [Chitinophaga skermanii]